MDFATDTTKYARLTAAKRKFEIEVLAAALPQL
jgi:hypothetical protein